MRPTGADTKVSIKGENGDYHGYVKSSDPANCAADLAEANGTRYHFLLRQGDEAPGPVQGRDLKDDHRLGRDPTGAGTAPRWP